MATPSLSEAVACPFLLALTAGGLGGARALTSWPRLVGLLPDRLRSLTVGTAGALAVVVAVGALIAGSSLALHLKEFRAVEGTLDPGAVGSALLLLAQLAYVPNAVVWAISFTLGPGFAFGTGTVIAPTGSALGSRLLFPMLAALPSGMHSRSPFAGCSSCSEPSRSLAGAFEEQLTRRAALVLRAGGRATVGKVARGVGGCNLECSPRSLRRPAGR